MKPISMIQRFAAAAVAVFMATSTVFGMANLGYPEVAPVKLSVKRGNCVPS